MIARRPRTGTGLAAAVTLVAALALTACANGKSGGGTGNQVTSGQTPATAVLTAVTNLADQSSFKAVLSLPITAAQAKQLGSKGSEPTAAEASAISTGSIFVSETTGHGEALDSAQAQNDPLDSFDVGLTVGANTPAEIRYVGQSLYARVQLKQLLTDVGQNPAKASKFANGIGQLNQFVPGINAVGQGKWVEVSHAGLQSLASSLKQAFTTLGLDPAVLKTDISKFRGEVLAALRANSTFARLGDSSGRTEYSATFDVSNLVTALTHDLQSTFGNIPGVGSQITGGLNGAEKSIRAGQTAVFHLFVSGDKLTEADLDVNQFMHKYSFAVPVQAVFSSPGALAAPSGATTLDVSKLPGLLSGLLGSLGHLGLGGKSGTTLGA